MKTLIESGGFDNPIKITKSFSYNQACTIYYVRIVARKLLDDEK